MVDQDNKRPERVGELIKQALAQMLIDGLKDPRIGFATVTEVRVAPDLKSARVYVSVYGDTEQRDNSLLGLKAAAGYLKRQVGHELSLRRTPELMFYRDDTLDTAMRMEELMKAVASGSTETPKPEHHEALPVGTDRSELLARAREFEAQREQQAQKPKKRRDTRRHRR